MIYLMNSAVMPAGNYGTYRYSPATLDDLAAVLRGEHGPMQSCIGYSQNADLIEGWTGIRPEVARIEAEFRPGDRAIVMRLKSRVTNPATKGEPVSADPADWEFAWVDFGTNGHPGGLGMITEFSFTLQLGSNEDLLAYQEEMESYVDEQIHATVEVRFRRQGNSLSVGVISSLPDQDITPILRDLLFEID